MNMLTDSLITILEHPDAEKGYQDLRKYLQMVGRKEDAEAVNHLIKVKFRDVANDTSPDKEQ